MSANLKILNLMMGFLQPMLTSPNEAISSAAGEEMQELLKRRQKLLGQRGKASPAPLGKAEPEDAAAMAAVSA